MGHVASCMHSVTYIEVATRLTWHFGSMAGTNCIRLSCTVVCVSHSLLSVSPIHPIDLPAGVVKVANSAATPPAGSVVAGVFKCAATADTYSGSVVATCMFDGRVSAVSIIRTCVKGESTEGPCDKFDPCSPPF